MNDVTPKVDITELAKYINKIQELSSISKMMAPVYLRDYIIGQDVASHLLAKAIAADSRAKAKVEHAEAIAFLERAREYLEKHDIKDTAEARKQYICIDADVVEAKDKRAATEAMVALMKSKLSQLRQAHDDLKKIAYGDQNLTPYEGM